MCAGVAPVSSTLLRKTAPSKCGVPLMSVMHSHAHENANHNKCKKLDSLKHLVRRLWLDHTTKTANMKKALLLSSTSPCSPENYVFLCEQHLIDENVSINCIIACATRGYISAANLWGLGRIVFTAVQ